MLKTPAFIFSFLYSLWKVKICSLFISHLKKKLSILKFINIAFYILKIQLLVDIDMAADTNDSFVYSYAR
jgi:hypothetical protein